MTRKNENRTESPPEVRSGTRASSTTYTLLTDHYAVHRDGAGEEPPAESLFTMSEGESTIAVLRGGEGRREHASTSGEVGPVYTLKGGLAVPTGSVLIRFKEGVPVEEHRSEIEQAGYEVTQVLDYAPHAAWLRARSGNIADALNDLRSLEVIADVENIEPQMLMQRVAR